ncbi:DUF4322 domain-containing protein [Saccharolobus islandicus]|uniref:DUF4322 domain-containing protein n=1 Tax=Saccharolobus islandicus TaxID=43080 RepID=UPI00037B6BBF|nr:DUF4322 domain-containing protein [Sulfolobus islandicus]
MVTPTSPNQVDIHQVKNKLSSILDFQGRKAEQVKQVLVSAAITRDSENKAKQYCISPQTVRNYVEQTVIDKIMERIKKPSIKILLKNTDQ